MEAIFTEYPVLASIIGSTVFVVVGAIDLIVLKNTAIAFLFWVIGFFVALAPLINLPSLGGVEVLLIVIFGVAYIFAVYRTYRAFRN
jgi:hypothetical protein